MNNIIKMIILLLVGTLQSCCDEKLISVKSTSFIFMNEEKSNDSVYIKSIERVYTVGAVNNNRVIIPQINQNSNPLIFSKFTLPISYAMDSTIYVFGYFKMPSDSLVIFYNRKINFNGSNTCYDQTIISENIKKKSYFTSKNFDIRCLFFEDLKTYSQTNFTFFLENNTCTIIFNRKK